MTIHLSAYQYFILIIHRYINIPFPIHRFKQQATSCNLTSTDPEAPTDLIHHEVTIGIPPVAFFNVFQECAVHPAINLALIHLGMIVNSHL